MASQSPTRVAVTSIRHQIEPSSPLSSAPPSPPPRKRSVTPTSTTDNLPDTETASKMSTLGLDGSGDPPPKKRTKLTAEEKAEREKEKEEKRKEKEEKDKERAKLKAEREEQKKLKDEEKAKKDAEKAAEKARKDEEKKVKDEEKAAEKAKKEEERKAKDEERAAEKAKKERNQPRIASFFKKPVVPGASNVAQSGASTSTVQAKLEITLAPSSPSAPSSSTTDIEMTNTVDKVRKTSKSDYVKSFQPFFTRPGVTVAPMHSFIKDEAATKYVCRKIDKSVLNLASQDDEGDDEMDVEFQPPRHLTGSYFQDLFCIPPAKRVKRGKRQRYCTKEILAGLNSSPGPIPIFNVNNGREPTDFLQELNKLPQKLLKYAEDVRPAYRGTFTRTPNTSGLRKGRNPFQRSLPGIDYDYDSEAEWIQGPEDEGEELLSEDDDDPVETGSADEMEDFLDDETEEPAKKRHVIAGPLIPVSSGIMWEDEHPKSEEWEKLKLGVLFVNHAVPIDPFSTKYWDKPTKQAGLLQPKLSNKPNENKAQTINQPLGGQQTLSFSNGSGNSHPLNSSGASLGGTSSHNNSVWTDKQPPMARWVTNQTAKDNINKMESNGIVVGSDDLADAIFAHRVGLTSQEQYTWFSQKYNLPNSMTNTSLKDIINFTVGNDHTKIVILELLKKQFTDCTKQQLKAFLDTFCKRQGPGNDKRWACEISLDSNGYWTRAPLA